MNATRTALCAGALSTALTLPATANSDSPLSWGADLRLRQIVIDNVGLNDASPNADRIFQRYRTRLWGSYAPTDTLTLSSRLVWEGRHYQSPQRSSWPGLENWYSGGILFDKLTLEANNLGGSPLSVTLGRQDIILGNGWLVLEGTPIDGSRTIYFDAARATYDISALDTTLDLIYIDQSADTGRFPQSLNDNIEDVTEQHESGVILYARNKGLIGGDLDAYIMYKHNRRNLTAGNLRIDNGAPFPSPSDSGDIYTAGLRANTKLGSGWSLRAEGAYQWGTRNERDLDAFGFNSRLSYQLKDRFKSTLHADYEFLSGDDPDSADDQAFDPLWGRWPQWSELMVYQWPLESRVAEATNLHRLNLGWIAQVHSTTQLKLDYHALWADEQNTRTAAQLANLSGESDFRGHLFTAWLKTKLNKHVSGHLVAEYLATGDYYAEHRRDDAFFVRAELSLAW